MAMNIYFQILKKWCDRLVELQITEKSEPELYGGILCPSCGRIHGRCNDAMYPMLYMYKETKDRKYKDCAMRLLAWSDNMFHQEGFFYNDTNSNWRGITVFSASQMGESLLEFGELLTSEEYGRIRNRFVVCAEYLWENIEAIGGNINYPVTCACTMAIARAVTGEEKYSKKARQLAEKALQHITEDGLLYGEGHDREEISAKGCRPVDIGYNVEESLPALLQYAILEKDNETYERTVEAMRTHLEFMLPDGAWDNSMGTRNYKWSYWGSRTSDGCLTGYGLVDDPMFLEAVRRNTLLLEKCTGNGLLYGGPMFADAGEPPCVHHTFCHAKAFASLLQKASPENREFPDTLEKLESFEEEILLPSDTRNGVIYFPSMDVLLLGKGDWRATITGYDVEYCRWGHASGGAVSLLWNRKQGPILIGTMGRYEMVEPNNMQLLRNSMPACLTPRVEYISEGKCWRNIYDKKAQIVWEEQKDTILVTVTGKMTSEDGAEGEDFRLDYEMSEGRFVIKAHCAFPGTNLILPFVSRENGDGVPRIFSPVGGMLAVEKRFALTEENGYTCEIAE